MNTISLLCCAISSLIVIATSCSNTADDDRRSANRLADATSPYLREHADNPVDWYEWGPEPLERARAENKPVLISIGYSSCHWCHVMEEESFMDTAVARFMNDNFVAIKIDREQRPDIDQIYLNAAQLISGSAGWPLNAFALPDGRPFYAATYFPKDQWMTLIQQVRDAFRDENETVVKQAEALTQGIQNYDLIEGPVGDTEAPARDRYEQFFRDLSARMDLVSGGQRGTPKFPMPANGEAFLQHYFITGEKKSLSIVTTTLDNIAMGGIYDHVGGGFARYSTDSLWRVPHFEKMLYDNAQLVSLYAHAYELTKNPYYREVIDETLDFIRREMTDDEGGFYSSINADSEGVEGKFYLWTADEIVALLGDPMAQRVMNYFNVTATGNWEEGKNILYTEQTNEVFASEIGISATEWSSDLNEAKKKLLNARNLRVHPSRDEKIITAWNALMIIGYADAFVATGQKEYLETAVSNATFLKRHMLKQGGGLYRNFSAGKAGIDAFLDDFALLSLAYIKVYQVTFDLRWLEDARLLVDYAITHFRDGNSGMFYYTNDGAEGLIVRKMEVTDDVIPSSNSVMAEVLFLLGQYFQDNAYANMGADLVKQVLKHHADDPAIYYANWGRVSGRLIFPPFEVAVMGDNALTTAHQLQAFYNPLVILSGGKNENLPLLENKLVAGKTMIYVCRNRICKLPVDDVGLAINQLEITK